MKRFLITVFSLAALNVTLLAGTAPIYENFGTVTTNAPIDATIFANYGDFSVFGLIPFDFQNTVIFTNKGTMSAYPGFRFATASQTSPPFRPAQQFVNEVGGNITAQDTANGITLGGSFGGFPSGSGQILSPSYLLVSSDSIINRGIMVAGAAGLLQLNGNTIDVSRSGLGIGRLEVTSTYFATLSNYFPDPGIYDLYWGITNDFGMRPGTLLSISKTATNFTTPRYAVSNSAAANFPIFDQIRLANLTNVGQQTISITTNAGGADPTTGRLTNIFKQLAVVGVSDTNFAVKIKWAPSTIFTNPYQSAIVEISLADTNTVTGDLEFSTLYLEDMLASWTNYVVLTNLSALPPTEMPATFSLTRTPPNDWFTGSPGKNVQLTNTFFFDAKDTNFLPVITNFYAAYSARVDSLASQPQAVQGLQIEDYPGRVEISGKDVDITRTRMRGVGLVSIKATNVVSTRGAIVDSENVIYDLGAPNRTLSIQGVAKDRVVRLNGNIRAYSAIFTNFFGVNTNVSIPDGSGGMTNVATNIVTEIDYHVLVVDATGLQATKPVFTHDFITHATDVVLSDPMTLERSLFIDADTLTLNNRLTLEGSFDSFGATNAPHLKSWTSKGAFTVPNVANFGQDLADGYNTFTNTGTIVANGILVKSGTFVNSGNITSLVEGIEIQAGSAQFQNSSTVAGGDLSLAATDARFTASTNVAGGCLILDATDSLSDSGVPGDNLFVAGTGFQLQTKPAHGDLLGSSIASIGPRFARVVHVWAGEDRGANVSGFQDNVALGQLILGGDLDTLMAFSGATGGNGLYVEELDLTGSLTNALANGDLSSALEIDPSLTIYFANSNVPTDQLVQQGGGRLVQVNFAGLASYVSVPLASGGSAQMEATVRNSTILDSDGDGIPNAYDAYPLDPAPALHLTGSRSDGQTSIAVSWQAQPQLSYRVEYATGLESPAWQLLFTFTNNGPGPQTAVVKDQLSSDHPQRYYRVRIAVPY